MLWKQESFLVLRPLQIEFFRSLLVVHGLLLCEQCAVASDIWSERVSIHYRLTLPLRSPEGISSAAMPDTLASLSDTPQTYAER